ncbi:MAG: ABC transporter ATP-binding protein [Rhodospirillaceae bacterium]|jgi:oligopeptide/dipeptide ABC transporter ATP-binding protein|nr:ABC transporter ATP-binding protein [Rhodospirillaceae bacterium]MBT5459097.1 ABC transporter ATP-binding protein [Rhodospirillaceae bacterium]
MADTILKVENLAKYFSMNSFFKLFGGSGDVLKAVDGINFAIARGETFGLVGESGSGKSTTARLITRLLDATRGNIEFDGEDILSLPKASFLAVRRRIQMVFQDPYTSLNPRMRVREALGNPLRLHKIVPSADVEGRVVDLLEMVGLQADHQYRYPHEFSGGQRQRISIARAMALEPDLIIADEAVSALDVSVRAQILNLFGQLRESKQLTYLFIAHDLSVVEHFCERVAVMYGGKIVEIGKVDDLFNDPRHPYTEALISAIPEPDPTLDFRPQVLEGEMVNLINRPSGCVFCGRCPVAEKICSEVEPALDEKADGRSVACHLR